ncbi:NAD(P)-dependent oxidoreductase [Rhodobacter sp. NSM]|uniref:NAD(P)-dependent oxidoreductase n=1 Tax=Rhodobacter sp. NSM TaxID=3457501 RepID=UPI003FD01014
MNEAADAGRIAFFGTGLMGAPMARQLIEAGFDLTVWNRSLAKAKALEPGARVAPTARVAAEGADVLVLMVSDGPACRQVLFDDGAAAAAAPGALLIVMSSIGHDEAQALAAETTARGLRWLDAPVSGGTVAAEAGALSIMAGGRAEDFEAGRPILSAMGKPIHIGPAGTGALTKLVNQLLVASTLAAVSEALLLAGAGGADLAQVREALMGGFASSRILELHGARMIARDFTPRGPAKYQLKDTRAAREVAEMLGLRLPLLDLADDLFRGLVAHGGGDLDHSALILELERRNGRAEALEAFLQKEPEKGGQS